MQSAKKLVLVNEFDREYKRLQRPTAAVVKANHSLSLSNTLCNSSLADDRKVRQYVGELHRYLNVNNQEPFAEQSTPATNIGLLNQNACNRAKERWKNSRKRKNTRC